MRTQNCLLYVNANGSYTDPALRVALSHCLGQMILLRNVALSMRQ